jgi:hypothetical protein
VGARLDAPDLQQDRAVALELETRLKIEARVTVASHAGNRQSFEEFPSIRREVHQAEHTTEHFARQQDEGIAA